ncbi:MAG: AraC family transcriptional regulator [Prevotella sp.]|nr:AraC family transcriptional regulator [Prevotella sp.]
MLEKRIVDIYLEEAQRAAGSVSLKEGLVLTDSIVASSNVHSPQRINYILMALCQSGEACYTIDTRQQTVKQGDLLFVSERHIVDGYQSSPDFKCQCIMVSTEFYHSFVLNVRNVSSLLLFSTKNPVVSLTEDEIKTYSDYFRHIREKMTADHPYRTQVVKALLLAMFYDMSGVIWRVERQEKSGQSRANVIFANFIRLLEEHFRSERRVGWYAGQLGISPKYLAEVVKLISKRTPNDWIDDYVVLELRVLLRNSSKTIKEITEMLHFPNQSFLGKYFKEHVGMSPSEYRRS